MLTQVRYFTERESSLVMVYAVRNSAFLYLMWGGQCHSRFWSAASPGRCVEELTPAGELVRVVVYTDHPIVARTTFD